MRLTTSPPSCAECHGIWEPKPPGTLWVTCGPLQNTFTFFFINWISCFLYSDWTDECRIWNLSYLPTLMACCAHSCMPFSQLEVLIWFTLRCEIILFSLLVLTRETWYWEASVWLAWFHQEDWNHGNESSFTRKGRSADSESKNEGAGEAEAREDWHWLPETSWCIFQVCFIVFV